MSTKVPVADVVEVDLGGRLVTVPRDGLYDRYRMATDLDEVAQDPRVLSVDFFRALPKTKVQSVIGTTLTPNFYYARRVSALISYTKLNGGWHATLSQTNTLAAGSQVFPRDLNLQLGSGRLTDDIGSLDPIRPVRLDVASESQNALHIPVPVSVSTK